MTTAALRLAGDHAATGTPERFSYGIVELQVTNLERAATFWSAALGLHVREESNAVLLGTAAKTLIVLHGGAHTPVTRGFSGLYHVAIAVPGQREFSRLLARLMRLRVPVSPVDHTMSKAIYLQDPDGIGIEIAYETPERFGRFEERLGAFILFDAKGERRSGVAPLDIPTELAPAQGLDLMEPIAQGTQIGHLHLHVPDLAEATVFYETLGFSRNLFMPQMGFADFGAGSAYTHRFAVNIWQGRNVPPPPPFMAGIRRYALIARTGALVSVQHSGDTLVSDREVTLTDPAGVTLTIAQGKEDPR